ncbi:DUF1127 domain-containing protein [Pseudomonas sp. X10]
MKGHNSSILHFKPHRHGVSLSGFALAMVRRLARWQQLYRQRQELASLSEETLRDLGLTRADVLQEVERPFWDDPFRK